MKVVIASYTYLPDIGGVATNVSILANEFAVLGHDVTVVTLSSGSCSQDRVRIVRNPGPALLFRLYSAADILIFANLALKLIFPMLFIRRKFALRHHSESAFHLSKSFFSWDCLRRNIRDRAVHFMTSHYTGQKSGLEGYEVTHPFANPQHISSAIIKLPSERSGLLFVGRLVPEKGVLYLLERWPLIKQELGVDELRIVGDGLSTQDVQAFIKRNPSSGVICLGGLPLSQTAAEMGKASYSIIPSLWDEPFGAVALEALAACSIVLHTDRGGLPETTDDLGFIFDSDSESSLLAALKNARTKHDALLKYQDQWVQYQAAVAAHLTKFSPKSVVEKIILRMR